MGHEEVDKLIKKIPNGKIYEKTEEGYYYVVMYKDNTIAYALQPEALDSAEIKEILEELNMSF